MKICGSEQDRNYWPSRYCGGLGHTLRKPASSTIRQTLTWNPQGKRKRGQPHNSWRRDTEAELIQQGTNWSGMTRAAQNRVQWRGVVDGLSSTGSEGNKEVSDNWFIVQAACCGPSHPFAAKRLNAHVRKREGVCGCVCLCVCV